MREIDLNAPPTRLTAMMYGASRVGKTRFAGTWPRPYFFSDAVEGGWETLRPEKMGADYYEPGVVPKVVGIENYKDMIAGLKTFGEIVNKTPGKYLTAVVDSITFLSDMLQAEFLMQFAGQIAENKYFLWDKLFSSMRHLMIEAHKIPVNWLWLALPKEGSGRGKGGPQVGGQMGNKLPAAVNMLLYQTIEHDDDGNQQFQTRTKPYGAFLAGVKSGELPDPLPESSYKAIEAAWNLPAPSSNGASSLRPVARQAIRATR